MALTQQDKEELYQYIISRGRGIASLPDGDSDLSNKYLGPVIEYTSGGTAGRLVRLAVSLLQGKGATMRRNGDEVQWKLQGSTDVWETLFTVSSLKGDKGENGKSPVFRKGETTLEYKLEGEEDTTYKTLVALSEITGPEGDHIVLRSSNGRIEYKQSKEPDTAYRELLLMEDIRGAKGDTGPAPILELGEVTTVEPSDPASATFQPNGVDPSGANKYRLALSIPKGKSGQDGTGAGNVLVNNEASLLASKQYAFKPGQDGSVNGAFVEVEASGKAAIPIPPEITGLNNESTSDEIKAVLGGDEGFDRIYEGAKNGVCFLDLGVTSEGTVTGGFICQAYQSGLDSGAKMIMIGVDLSITGAGLFQCMIAKEGDVYSADSTMQEGGEYLTLDLNDEGLKGFWVRSNRIDVVNLFDFFQGKATISTNAPLLNWGSDGDIWIQYKE